MRPGKPCVDSITRENISITWDPPTELFTNYSYQLRYKQCGTSMKWAFYQDSLAHPSVTLNNLKPGTPFVFQVRMVADESEGPYSELSDPITNYVVKTLEKDKMEVRQPGKPCVDSITKDHVSLAWEPPKQLFTDHSYQLRYKEYNTQMKWIFYPEYLAHPSVTLQDLKSGTQFVFQVRMVANEIEGPYCELSDPITTHVDTEIDRCSKEARQPGKPCVDSIAKDHVSLAWNPPEELFTDYSYQLRYKECNTQMKWIFYPEYLAQASVTLHNLKSGTQFVFQQRQPGKPCVDSITKDKVSLAWNPPEELFTDHSYQLRYKEYTTQMKWIFYPEYLAHPSVTLHNLKSGTQFVFQVRMVENEIEGPYSELSDPITNQVDTAIDRCSKEARRPGKPFVDSNTVNHVSLTWDPPDELFTDHSYQLRFKECNTQMKWIFYPESLAHPSVTLHNLKSGTQFVFQVRMVENENEAPYSELSDPIETMQSAAERFLEFMHDVHNPDMKLKLKKVPLKENRNARNCTWKTRKFYLGDGKILSPREKTILLVGATGTGKTTLVDGMINYVLGVKWSDPYRLTLVEMEDEEGNRNVDQAVSQTQWITCYTINPCSGGRLNYKLNIIDTPGFGDTSGIERDKRIVQQIKHLFSREDDTGVLFIDAVCFIIKAPDARLTPTQLYIFNAIMSLFGQDIAQNFSMLITFADGKQPPVLSALKKARLPHEDHFPFNNSGLFADNTGSNESDFASMFWKMGCQSFEKFFERLAKMETRSLRQTRDVLTYREKVEMTMENLMPLVDGGLSKIEETRQEIAILNDFKIEIEANSDFKYTVTETQQEQKDLHKGQHVTNCLNCHFTCHQNCLIPNDEDKKRCVAMDCSGLCTQCPDKCKWDCHRNTPYIFEYVSVRKEKTYAEKLKKYRLATDEKMTREKVVERMQKEMRDLEGEILKLMEEINECNNELRKIALRPDPLSLVEHIDLLIESEKLEKRTGFQSRIASLQIYRRQANVSDDILKIRAEVKRPKERERTNQKWIIGLFQAVACRFTAVATSAIR